MKYEAEFIGGHVAPVVVSAESPDFMVGLAYDARGYARAVFFTPTSHQPDPWIAAVRPVTSPTKACQPYQLPELRGVVRGTSLERTA
jgi:hypothetical protein